MSDVDESLRYLSLIALMGENAVSRHTAAALAEVERLRVENAALGIERDRLLLWKVEAAAVLSTWESVWEALGQPGPLGASKAEVCRAEVERLRAAVARVEALHRIYFDPGTGHAYCYRCEYGYPCTTILALRGES